MNKTVLLPIVSAAAIILKNVFGVEVGDDTQNAIVDLALGAVVIYGIIKNHKTPKA
jgi:uncharacterized membrane protein